MADTAPKGLILDPDTLELPDGTRTRLQGADAWETGHPSAERGNRVLMRDLDWGSIERGGKDHYGRTLIKARTKDGQDLASYLIEGGYAYAMRGATQEQMNAEATYAYRGGAGGQFFETPDVRDNRTGLREEWATAPAPDYTRALRGGVTERSGTFGTAYKRGVEQNKANVGALVHMLGEWGGVEAISDWGEDVMEAGQSAATRYSPEVGTFTNIKDVDDAWTYAVEALGENAFTLLAMAASAGIGALGARAAAGAMSRKLIEKHGVEAARQKVAAISKGGAMAGTGAASYTMVTGELANEFEEHGLFNPGLVLATGVPMAALDTFSTVFIAKPMFEALEKVAAQGLKTDHLTKVLAKSMGAHMTRGFAAEAPTEALQESMMLAARTIEDPNFHMLSAEEQENTFVQLMDAFLKGGIVGGAMGAAPGAVQGVRTYNQLQGEGATDPNVAHTRPEGPGDIAAQIAAHSAGLRAPVWVEGTQPPPQETGLTEVSIPNKGTFLVMPEQAEAVQKQVVEGVNRGYEAEDIVASVLGYGKPKSQLDVESTVAVMGKDRQGNVVWTELADAETLELAKGRAQKAAGEGGTVVEQTPEQALKDREDRRTAPAELRTQFGEELKDAGPKAKAEARKRVKDMTVEEMQQALLTNFATGLPNARAFEELDAKALPALASVDMDSLKWFNDAINHEAGDAALRAVAQAFNEALAAQPKDSVAIAHKSGDEFLVRAKTQARANAFLKDVQRRLDKVELKFTGKDGVPITKKGLGISYGVTAKGMAEAEARLQEMKAKRAKEGKRPDPADRGAEPPGVIRGAKPKADKKADTKPESEADPTAQAKGFPQKKEADKKADKEPDPKAHAKGFAQKESAPEPDAEPVVTVASAREIRLRVANLRTKTQIGSLLDWIIAIGTPRQKALAEAVKKAVPGILEIPVNKGKPTPGALATAKLGSKADGSEVHIAFDHALLTERATEHGSVEMVTEVALHEVLHVALISRVGWTTVGVASRNDMDAFLEAQTVFNLFRTYARSLKGQPLSAMERWVLGMAYQNLDEFLVLAMSNEIVQEHLARIEISSKRTAWDAFVDMFMKIVGLAKETRTALDEALQIGAGILNLQPSLEVVGKPLDQVKLSVEVEVDGEKVTLRDVKAAEMLKVADERIETLEKLRKCLG